MTVAYQQGRAALFKYSTGTSPITYVTVGGLRNVDLTIDTGAVDVTNKDSAGYQTMLPGAGTWKATVAAQGLFDDGTSIKAVLLSANVAQTLISGEIIFGNGDAYSGKWIVRTLKRTGTYQDAETYDITLESSGTMTFTAGT